MLLTIEQFCPVEVVKSGKRKSELIGVRRRYAIEVPQVASNQIETSIRWSDISHGYDGLSGERFAVDDAGCFETVDPKALNKTASWHSLLICSTVVTPDLGLPFPWLPGFGFPFAKETFFDEMPEVRQIVRDYGAEVEAAMQGLADTMVTDGRRILRPGVEPRWEVHCLTDGRYNMFGVSVTEPKYDSITQYAFRFDDAEGAVAFATERGAGDHLQWARNATIEIPRPELLHFDPEQFHALAVARYILWTSVDHLAELTTPQLTAYGVLRDKVRQWQKAPSKAPTADVAAAVADAWVDLSSASLNQYRAVQEGHRRIVESVVGVQQTTEEEFSGLSETMSP